MSIDRSQYEVPFEDRIGSEENYIVATQSRVERSGLQVHMPSYLHQPDFSRNNPTRKPDYDNVAAMNMLSIPTLTENELRLGIFLYEYSVRKSTYNFVFSLGDKDFRTQKIGDKSGGIHINKLGSSKHSYEIMPFVSLSAVLRKNKIRMDFEKLSLRSDLQKLASFGVLTLTEIDHTNCIKPNTPEYCTNCVLIELNSGFETAPINRKWLT